VKVDKLDEKKFRKHLKHTATSTAMPTATTAKSAMAGTKRKSSPVKNVHVKESKKPKIDSSMKFVLKTKSKPLPVKVKEFSDVDSEDSEDSDSDGGVPLNFGSDESDDEEEVEEAEDVGEGKSDSKDDKSDAEEVQKSTDSLHPERAKAVVTNSKISHFALKAPD
jgi:pumilio family protein 6